MKKLTRTLGTVFILPRVFWLGTLLTTAGSFAGTAAQAFSLTGHNVNAPIPNRLAVSDDYSSSPGEGSVYPPAFLTFAETETSASLMLKGGDFSPGEQDTEGSFTLTGDFWQGDFSIVQGAGLGEPETARAYINGSLQHVSGPEPGQPPSQPFSFEFGINTDNFFVEDENGAVFFDDTKLGKSTVSKSGSAIHPGANSSDRYNAKFTANTELDPDFLFGLANVTSYTLTLDAAHEQNAKPVPEPSTMFGLLATAGLGINSLLQRRKIAKKS